MKQTINQVFVVEGKHDTARLKKLFDCDTIETSGTHLSKDVLAYIQNVQKKRGVIIFTDPDAPGNQIRHRINTYVHGCLNAFVDKQDAKTDKKVGVEHASDEAIMSAIRHLVTITPPTHPRLTMTDMYELKIVGHETSKAIREKVGRKLHIGFGNGKTMCHRLNCLHITKEELKEIIDE